MIRIKIRRGENEGTERGIWDVAWGICRLQGSYFWVSKGVEVCFLRHPLYEF